MASLSLFVFFLFFQVLPITLTVDYSLLDSYRPRPTPKFEIVQSLLNIPLQSLLLSPANLLSKHFLQNNTSESLNLSQNCTVAFKNFSDSLLNFSRCCIVNARPIRICMTCHEEYQTAEQAYENLKKNQGAECQAFFFSSDQLAIVDIVYNDAMQLWSKSVCQNCYDHLNDTREFFENALDLQICIENSNKTGVMNKNSTCAECDTVYANMSSTYKRFVKNRREYESGICMDIVDAMNISRKIWSELKCTVTFKSTIGFLNAITAITIGATPVMFYLLAKNISRLEDIKLVRPKRKSTTVPPASNGQ